MVSQSRRRPEVNPRLNQRTRCSDEPWVRWFKRGFTSGRLRDCDTMSASRL